jgi:hypothetical protein
MMGARVDQTSRLGQAVLIIKLGPSSRRGFICPRNVTYILPERPIPRYALLNVYGSPLD